MLRIRCLLVVAAAALLPAGCTPKSEKTVTISGTVHLDGKPMPDGEITFVGTDGSVPVALPVQNGAFKGAVRPGKKRVEIRAYREAKPEAGTDVSKDQGLPGGGATRENYLPSKFNTESTMMAEVSDRGVLTPNAFEVESN